MNPHAVYSAARLNTPTQPPTAVDASGDRKPVKKTKHDVILIARTKIKRNSPFASLRPAVAGGPIGPFGARQKTLLRDPHTLPRCISNTTSSPFAHRFGGTEYPYALAWALSPLAFRTRQPLYKRHDVILIARTKCKINSPKRSLPGAFFQTASPVVSEFGEVRRLRLVSWVTHPLEHAALEVRGDDDGAFSSRQRAH